MHGAEPDPGLSCSATIRRDHSVAPPTEPEGRADREYWLMKALCGSSIWVLMAASLKAHSLHQSGLANQLSKNLNLRSTKGKSKGKTPPAAPTN